MKLTPLDIRHQEFKRGMRGYADEEVDEFLDEVADEYERLFKENIDLSERLESLEDKVKQYRRIEETLQKTLVSAPAVGRGAQGERDQGVAAHPPRRGAQGAADGERPVQRPAEPREEHRRAARGRAGRALPSAYHARDLPQAARGGAAGGCGGAEERRLRRSRPGHQGGDRSGGDGRRLPRRRSR